MCLTVSYVCVCPHCQIYELVKFLIVVYEIETFKGDVK